MVTHAHCIKTFFILSKSFLLLLKNSALKKILVAIYPSTSRKRSVKNIPPSKFFFLTELEMIWCGNTTSTTHERRPHTDTSRENHSLEQKITNVWSDMLLMLQEKQCYSKLKQNPTSQEHNLNTTNVWALFLVKGKVYPKSKFLSSFSYHLVNINSKRRCLSGCSCCSFPYNESEWWPKAPIKAP